MSGAALHHLVEPLSLALPFWRYAEAFRGEPFSFLLDSARDPGTLGRASFLGGAPAMVYTARRTRGAGPGEPARVEELHLRAADGEPLRTPVTERREAGLLADLKAVLDRHRVPRERMAAAPAPFLAGAVGHLSYDLGASIERVPDRAEDDLELPDVGLLFCDAVLGHDAGTGATWVSALGRGPTVDAARRRAARHRDELLARVRGFEREAPAPWTPPVPGPAALEVRARFDREGYAGRVRAAKEHILAGDAFELCLTHRLEVPFTGDPWALYQALRAINPAPFASYLRTPWATVVSSSPERFLRLGADRVAETRPIKGTRPRGATPAEDAALREDLTRSEKDRAENVMIVDLARNDLGRVCRFHSVEVPELMVVEAYASVFQLVSTVRGTLRDDVDPLDLVAACMPGGSMTGAPKVEAMRLIERLEPVKRGIYSGAIGYLDFSGPLDLAMVIRTVVVQGERAHLGVGGAVVADSDPGAEYDETMDKARALLAALALVEGKRPP